MEPTRKNRISVGGLRKADPTTLTVLTQDVIRLPLGQIERRTLLDLLALSEVPEQLKGTLPKELEHLRHQMYREIDDLPDGPGLAEFASELVGIPAASAPQSLRDKIGALVGERKNGDAVAALQELIAHWSSEPPAAVLLPVPKEPKTRKTAASASAAGEAPAAPAKTPKLTVVAPATATKKEKAAATPAAQVDTRREEWVREDVLGRLSQYGARGLKEPVVVAGARHRSPWKDMGEDEVLAVLRKLKREGKVHTSAGRWMIGA